MHFDFENEWIETANKSQFTQLNRMLESYTSATNNNLMTVPTVFSLFHFQFSLLQLANWSTKMQQIKHIQPTDSV